MMANKLIIAFLRRNGFKRMETNSYANEMCNVVLHNGGIAIADNLGYTYYTNAFNIYEMIGYLTYNSFLQENYKR